MHCLHHQQEDEMKNQEADSNLSDTKNQDEDNVINSQEKDVKADHPGNLFQPQGWVRVKMFMMVGWFWQDWGVAG